MSLCGRPHPSPGNLGHHRLSLTSLVPPAPQRWGSPSSLAIPAVLFPLDTSTSASPQPSPAAPLQCLLCRQELVPHHEPLQRGFGHAMCLCNTYLKNCSYGSIFPFSLFSEVLTEHLSQCLIPTLFHRAAVTQQRSFSLPCSLSCTAALGKANGPR